MIPTGFQILNGEVDPHLDLGFSDGESHAKEQENKWKLLFRVLGCGIYNSYNPEEWRIKAKMTRKKKL